MTSEIGLPVASSGTPASVSVGQPTASTSAPLPSTSLSQSTVPSGSTPSVDLDERKVSEMALRAAEDKLQSLCVSHAATFVAVERRGGDLTASLQKLICSLNSSIEGVAKSKRFLESATDEGKESTLTTLAEKHRLRRRTLLQHSSLLELLELPNLMDACVRGRLYEEALNIANFANTLERRHMHSMSVTSASVSCALEEQKQAPNDDSYTQSHSNHDVSQKQDCNPVVANVVSEVRKRELDLRRHLLHSLRSDVTMPQCLEVVTALRRLNGVDLERSSIGSATRALDIEKIHEAMERSLQVDFLEARDVWLDGTTNASPATTVSANKHATKSSLAYPTNASKSEQLLDSIDVYRTRCFEITTQFLAIFRTSTQQTATSITLSKSTNSPDHALQLLSIWTTRRIQYFIDTVLSKTRLATITDTTTLRDALESANFFATSMGRIGADFSPLLPNVFEPCLLRLVTSHWIDGVNALKETLKVCRDAGIASPLHSTSGTTSITPAVTDGDDDVDDNTDNIKRANTNKESIGSVPRQSKTPSPPRQLLSLPPLARLVNAFLVGLNELRRCLLPDTFPKLRTFFRQEFVTKVMEIFRQNERVVLTPGFLNQKGEEAGKLRTLAVELKETFESCVEPYLNGALEVAFGVFGVCGIQKDIVPEEAREDRKEDGQDTKEGGEEDGKEDGKEDEKEDEKDDESKVEEHCTQEINASKDQDMNTNEDMKDDVEVNDSGNKETTNTNDAETPLH